MEPLENVVVVPLVLAKNDLRAASFQPVGVGRAVHELDIGFDAHIGQHLLGDFRQSPVLVFLIGPSS